MTGRHKRRDHGEGEDSQALMVYMISIAERMSDMQGELQLLSRTLSDRLGELETTCRCRCQKSHGKTAERDRD